MHKRRHLSILVGSLTLLISGGCCLAQDHEVVCTNGAGSFQSASASAVLVRVGAAKSGSMSTHVCEATLRSKGQLIAVASSAAQIDLDAFGADLGLGAPIAAFQVRASADQCCMEYQLYSLEKQPRLLRTLTGGDFFTAADTDLDGRVEIWTTDAAAVGGFEKLDLAELDSAPTIVLRFEHGDLIDVSTEFRDYFDTQIASLRKQLSASDLSEFKATDGRLSPTAYPAQNAHRMRQVKIKILEIVWSYLYSARETQAWSVLAEMWPDGDIARIRAAIVEARTHGILAQTAGASALSSVKKLRRVRINAIIQPSAAKPEVSPPEPILLWRPPPPETPNQSSSSSEFFLDLTIDSAGKVRSAEPDRRLNELDAAILKAAAGWKFIPAFDGGRPVACRTRMAVSLQQ